MPYELTRKFDAVIPRCYTIMNIQTFRAVDF